MTKSRVIQKTIILEKFKNMATTPHDTHSKFTLDVAKVNIPLVARSFR